MNNSRLINRLPLLVLPINSASMKEDAIHWQALLIQLLNRNIVKKCSASHILVSVIATL